MGDSPTMTIEFLRARLLSERSVSRTAKQRAAQLAKRVMELEEQLRIVTLQRKKAEKAAAEVLAILETRRIGDLSEPIEWDSERDVPSRNGGGDSLKENGSSTASRTEKSEVEDGLSGSEPEISPSQGKKLSWKSRNENPDSHDNQRAKETKHRQRDIHFAPSLKSLSKRHSGKSCRKIVRRDTGSTTESEKHMPSLLDAHGNGAVACPNGPDDYSEISKEATRVEIEETLADTSVSHFVDDQSKETSDGPYIHGNGADNEMERVLEQQAQLIDQFQAEENAQREWEDKYNENKMSTQVCHENGNPFSLAGNSSQNEESSEAADRTPHDVEEPKQSGNISNTNKPTTNDTSSENSTTLKDPLDVAFSNGFMATSSENSTTLKDPLDVAFSNGFMATDRTNGGSFKAWRTETKTKSSYQEFAFPALENSDTLDDNTNSRLRSDEHMTPENSARSTFRRDLPPVPTGSLGGVLESLHRAKLSLRQELNKLPPPRHGTMAIAATTTSARTSSAPLFRLPFDSFPQAQFSRPKFYTSEFGSSPSVREVGHGNGLYNFQNPTFTPFAEARSRNLLGKDRYDLSSSMGSSKFPDLSTERAPSRSELLKSYSDVRSGMPPGDFYTLYGGDSARSNMRML